MGWGSLVAIYFVCWWVLLFAALPFGVTSQSETGDVAPGTDPGAPVAPRLLAKAFWTSVIALPATALLVWMAGRLFD